MSWGTFSVDQAQPFRKVARVWSQRSGLVDVGHVAGVAEDDRASAADLDPRQEPGERGGPPASLPPEDHLQRLALLLIGSLIDEERRSDIPGFTRPGILAKWPSITTFNSFSAVSP